MCVRRRLDALTGASADERRSHRQPRADEAPEDDAEHAMPAAAMDLSRPRSRWCDEGSIAEAAARHAPHIVAARRRRRRVHHLGEARRVEERAAVDEPSRRRPLHSCPHGVHRSQGVPRRRAQEAVRAVRGELADAHRSRRREATDGRRHVALQHHVLECEDRTAAARHMAMAGA